MAFKYVGRTAEDVKREANKKGGGFDSIWKQGVAIFKPKEGENAIRILPGNSTWDNKKWGTGWGIDIYVHRNVGVDTASYLCVNKMFNKPCAICDALAGADAQEVKDMRATLSVAAYIIDRDNEKEGVLAWTMPQQKVASVIYGASTERKTGAVINVDDPDEGYDIIFTKVGKNKNTDYRGVQLDREATPLSAKLSRQEAWLQFISDNKLHDQFNIYDYDYLEKVVKGKSSRKEEDDEDEEDKPRGRSRARDDDEEEDRRGSRGRRASRDEDDEEEERPRGRARGRDDEDEEEEKPRGRRSARDEDDEDEKPKARSRARDDEDEEDEKPKSRSRSRDDEDEEDEKPRGRKSSRDDDEDEEDEKPKSRSRSRDDDDEDEKPKARSRSRDEDEDEEDEKPRGRKAAKEEDEFDDEIPSKGKGRAQAKDDDEDVTKQAKGKLQRLRSGRK